MNQYQEEVDIQWDTYGMKFSEEEEPVAVVEHTPMHVHTHTHCCATVAAFKKCVHSGGKFPGHRLDIPHVPSYSQEPVCQSELLLKHQQVNICFCITEHK